ncbi:cyanophycinase [Pontibacter burrus]|uniref:Cyanophycinase n=1 Tax=Pontibacter burrus TaxID=2704466 RepID=A0A6B3LXJ5_9BACT|nr:cyanophycinase [Pontibacter burrus]NEM98538.1 cyanophycinase [Pontibacter burrus]
MAKKEKEEVKKQFPIESRMPHPKGKLLAIGGREDKGEEKSELQSHSQDFIKEEILKCFVDNLKGSNPLIVIIPTAASEPEKTANDYVKVFTHLGVTNLHVLDIRDRSDAMKPENVEVISKAAGVMITGGDQLKLTAILGGTPLLEKLKERYTKENIIVAGTSAGAAALSTPMIYEGEMNKGMLKGDVRITTGLEFLKNVAIDTHFIQRGRIVRMAQCIATNPGCIGVGLEEDTAILVTEGKKAEVIGTGLVTIVNGMNITRSNIYEITNQQPFTVCGLEVHLLSSKETYVFPTFEQLHA